MIVDWLVVVIVTIVLNIAAYIITPKPKAPKPDAVQDSEGPTASAGRPIPVIFGTVTIKSPNVLWFGEKSNQAYEVKA